MVKYSLDINVKHHNREAFYVCVYHGFTANLCDCKCVLL